MELKKFKKFWVKMQREETFNFFANLQGILDEKELSFPLK
jgi:hypothetical protein